MGSSRDKYKPDKPVSAVRLCIRLLACMHTPCRCHALPRHCHHRASSLPQVFIGNFDYEATEDEVCCWIFVTFGLSPSNKRMLLFVTNAAAADCRR